MYFGCFALAREIARKRNKGGGEVGPRGRDFPPSRKRIAPDSVDWDRVFGAAGDLIKTMKRLFLNWKSIQVVWSNVSAFRISFFLDSLMVVQDGED